MSRYRGPRLRVVRRLGDLPGLTRKSARKAYPPGQHGQSRRKRSEYAIRLEEKQKLRFNNTIFRLGMAGTIPAARQLVNHGHITVNDRVVDVPSYQCRPGDLIKVRNRDRSRKLVETNMEYPGLANLPSHLEFDKAALSGKVNGIIEREWIALQVNELLVVEYYSRMA
ncbi:MAG: hypothetical protein RLZZ04_1424 [Cyanobacteriota bacterium]